MGSSPGEVWLKRESALMPLSPGHAFATNPLRYLWVTGWGQTLYNFFSIIISSIPDADARTEISSVPGPRDAILSGE